MACYANMREHVYLGVFVSVNRCKSCNNNKILSGNESLLLYNINDCSLHKKTVKYVCYNVVQTRSI